LAFREEDTQVLIQLGLTNSQAKVYLTLLKIGQTTGKNVSKNSKVARQEVYRILGELQDKGLIEKLIALPTEFKPIPIQACLQTLIKQKKKEISETEKISEKDSFFILVPEKEAYIRRFQNSISKAKTSVDMLLHWDCFRYGMIEDLELWKKTVEKGVKIRLIVYKNQEEMDVSRTAEFLKKQGNFEVKYIFLAPPATVAIFDKKEASISVSPAPNPHNTCSLWSNNFGLIAIFEDYFELNWRTSHKGKQILKKEVNYLEGYT
jgi:sugar-specific transcriptional regulator TrmB